MRTIVSFNEGWLFTKQGKDEPVTLPHTWNAVDGQDGGDDYYRGACRYTKQFPKPALNPGEEAWLEFKGAAYTADVSVNGEALCHHEGGFSTFRIKLPELKDENTVEVRVDNSSNDRVYPQKADFTFYGGLYRDVNLIIVPASHFELGYCGTSGIKVTPIVNLETKSAALTVETWQNGEEVTVTVDGQSKTVPSVDGYAKAEFTIENVHLWDGVDDPYLYTATATLPSGDRVSTRFGCRNYKIDPQKGFILNGRSYPLRGGARHQDCKGVGNALTREHHKQDMEIIRELGANTLRLAHYQHAQEFYDLCDENGIIVWAEIPYITMHMKNGRANTLSQMEELIVQCYNHPSIAVWGLSNEITAASPVNDSLIENHRALNDLCHKLDPTRPTTMANVFMLDIDSPLLEIPDVNSYNLYFGWYVGDLEQNDEFFDEYHAKFPNRCIGLSEYGADANPQYQSLAPEKGDYIHHDLYRPNRGRLPFCHRRDAGSHGPGPVRRLYPALGPDCREICQQGLRQNTEPGYRHCAGHSRPCNFLVLPAQLTFSISFLGGSIYEHNSGHHPLRCGGRFSGRWRKLLFGYSICYRQAF